MTNTNSENMYITGSETKNVIQASNNRSRYYAELAEKYKDEAKGFRDDAQYYAEQNADVSKAYVDEIDITLRNLIATKQNAGNYALSSDIPTKLSDLTNDASFVNSTELSSAISAQALITAAEIGNKANKDCDNLSVTGKNNIVNIVHNLDWTNAVLASTTSSDVVASYLCPNDGVIFLYAYSGGGSSIKRIETGFLTSDNASSGPYLDYTSLQWNSSYTQTCGCSRMYIKDQTAYYRVVATNGTSQGVQVYFVPFRKTI